MWVECAVCSPVQPDVMTSVKTPFCFETQRPCGSVHTCIVDTGTDDTSAQVKDVTLSVIISWSTRLPVHGPFLEQVPHNLLGVPLTRPQ